MRRLIFVILSCLALLCLMPEATHGGDWAIWINLGGYGYWDGGYMYGGYYPYTAYYGWGYPYWYSNYWYDSAWYTSPYIYYPSYACYPNYVYSPRYYCRPTYYPSYCPRYSYRSPCYRSAYGSSYWPISTGHGHYYSGRSGYSGSFRTQGALPLATPVAPAIRPTVPLTTPTTPGIQPRVSWPSGGSGYRGHGTGSFRGSPGGMAPGHVGMPSRMPGGAGFMGSSRRH